MDIRFGVSQCGHVLHSTALGRYDVCMKLRVRKMSDGTAMIWFVSDGVTTMESWKFYTLSSAVAAIPYALEVWA